MAKKKNRRRGATRQRAHGVSAVEPRSRPHAIEAVVRRIARKAAARAPAEAFSSASQTVALQFIRHLEDQDRTETLARLSRYEATARAWHDEAMHQLAKLTLPGPRHFVLEDGRTRIEFPEPSKLPAAARPIDYLCRGTGRLLDRIPKARWLLTHGRRADRDLADIYAVAGRLNGFIQEKRLKKYQGGKQDKGVLWQALAEIVATEPPKRSWAEVLRAVAKSGRLTAATVKGRSLAYEDPPGCPLDIQPRSFQAKLSSVRRLAKKRVSTQRTL